MNWKYFVRGIGSVFSIIPNEEIRHYEKHFKSDAEAIKSDWKKVEKDLENALNRYSIRN